jgi:hypothetical protein
MDAQEFNKFINETEEGRKWIDVQKVQLHLALNSELDKTAKEVLQVWSDVDSEIRKYNRELEE